MYRYRTARNRFTPSPNVVELRPVARVNDDTAGQMLASMSNVELDLHIAKIAEEHDIKRQALATVANSLARALNERNLRRG